MLQTKAQMLYRLLSSRPQAFVIDQLDVFTVAEWNESSDSVLSRLAIEYSGCTVVVRSSAVIEDIDPTLPHGFFHSQLGVLADDITALRAAISSVIDSYGRHEKTRSDLGRNEVLVQRQVNEPRLAGIADTGPPGCLYFQVEYDDETGRTDTVTAGHRTRRIDLLRNKYSLPEPWTSIRVALLEVEQLLLASGLFIEFAVDSENKVHVFQAKQRPKSLSKPIDRVASSTTQELLTVAHSTLEKQGAWSDMADWNPAEMLGDRPTPMAASLYQRVVTNNAWLQGRVALGYRAVEPQPLVELLAEKPYVNLRKSFLSLTPASIDLSMAKRLVDDRISALQERPDLHDKVEFELLLTTPDIAKLNRFRCLVDRGFDTSEVQNLESQLCRIASTAIAHHEVYCRADIRSTEDVVAWCRKAQSEVQKTDPTALLSFAERALTKCANEGVVPFSRQARLAFMARDMLNQFVLAGVLEQKWLDQWWQHLGTVALAVSTAIRSVGAGDITRTEFDAKFGHLRARTYDIRCPRYDQVSELASPVQPEPEERISPPPLPDKAAKAISGCLERTGVLYGAEAFLDFVSKVSQGREITKFAFTRVLSDALEAIARAGQIVGFTREELAFLRLEELLQPEGVNIDRDYWRSAADNGRARWEAAQNLSLPGVLFSADDLIAVRYRIGHPNFVTECIVTGEVVFLADPSPVTHGDLNHKIVAIEAADPGLDWLFAFPIAGLVTKYGGALSHMAVRCAEFGIPAAIGCGERIFVKVLEAGRLSLNCREQSIEFLRE